MTHQIVQLKYIGSGIKFEPTTENGVFIWKLEEKYGGNDISGDV